MHKRIVVAMAALAVVWPVLMAGLLPPPGVRSSTRRPSPGLSISRVRPRASRRDFAFVSVPDFLNVDLAGVRGSRFWKPGDPNSIDRRYHRSLETLLEDLRTWPGRDVLLAGDAVGGHWGRDDRRTGIFGPVRTEHQRVLAVRRAAATYFGAVRRRFSRHGLDLYPALGDHDIGDNPWWVPAGGWAAFKHRHLGVWKRAWARRFTSSGTRFSRRPVHTVAARTAYAVKLAPSVLLVTVDEFLETRRAVALRLGRGQLRWFVRTLAAARRRGTRWIIVQGHLPVLEPVDADHSSNLRYHGGTSSPFWRAMRTYGVDLYLCGEVHATTASRPLHGGPLQIAHGGLVSHGEASFLSGRLRDGTMRLRTWDWRARRHRARPRVWQTDGHDLRHDWVYTPGPRVTGYLVLTNGGHVARRSGALAR